MMTCAGKASSGPRMLGTSQLPLSQLFLVSHPSTSIHFLLQPAAKLINFQLWIALRLQKRHAIWGNCEYYGPFLQPQRNVGCLFSRFGFCSRTFPTRNQVPHPIPPCHTAPHGGSTFCCFKFSSFLRCCFRLPVTIFDTGCRCLKNFTS